MQQTVIHIRRSNNRVTTPGFTYDTSGDVTDTGPSPTFSYNLENFMTAAGTCTYERDGESTLDYAIFRYDSSRLGRFMSPDPIAGSIADPQTLNRYPYVRNDPGNFADPLGLLLGPDDCIWIPHWLGENFHLDEVCPPGGGGGGTGAGDMENGPFGGGASQPPNRDVTLPILRTLDCNLTASELMGELKKNFSSLAGYSGPEGSISFEPEAIIPGAQIDISADLGWWTPEQNISVVVSRANQTSFTFSAVQGRHFFYPGTITFSTRDAGQGRVQFAAHISGNFAGGFWNAYTLKPRLGFWLGGEEFEATVWNNLANKLAELCKKGVNGK